MIPSTICIISANGSYEKDKKKFVTSIRSRRMGVVKETPKGFKLEDGRVVKKEQIDIIRVNDLLIVDEMNRVNLLAKTTLENEDIMIERLKTRLGVEIESNIQKLKDRIEAYESGVINTRVRKLD